MSERRNDRARTQNQSREPDPVFEGSFCYVRAFLINSLVKNPPAMQETPVRFLGQEDPLEKGSATTPVFLGFPCGSAGKESTCRCGSAVGLRLKLESHSGWGAPGAFPHRLLPGNPVPELSPLLAVPELSDFP